MDGSEGVPLPSGHDASTPAVLLDGYVSGGRGGGGPSGDGRGGGRSVGLAMALLVLAALLAAGATTVIVRGGAGSAAGPDRAIAPASPIDGKASKRHPVRVTPDTGLVDGQQVTVSGADFPPNVDIGVVMCTNAASTLGIDACDISTSSYLNDHPVRTSNEGTFSMTYTVRSHFRIKDPNAPVTTPPTSSGPEMVCTDEGDGRQSCSARGTVAPPPTVARTVITDAPAGAATPSTAGDGMATTTTVGPLTQPGTMEVDCLAGNVEPAAWAAKLAHEGPQASATDQPGAFTCMVAAGMISDYDQSGAWPIAFEGETFLYTTTTTAPPPETATTLPEPSTTTGPSTTVTGLPSETATTSPPYTTVGPTLMPTSALPPSASIVPSVAPGCPDPNGPPVTTIPAECVPRPPTP